MTQDAQLSAEKVAELEHKLADAAAEMAKVKEQLAQAQPVGGPLPPTGAPGTQIPSVPYGGAGSPHVITINGQQIVPGSGNVADLLRQFLPAAAGGTAVAGGGQAPVVVVNGQTLSGGQPIDMSSLVTPQVAQQLQSSLQQLGLDSRLGAFFGHQGGGAGDPPASVDVAPLADPPRHVPLALRLSIFAWSWVEVFCLVIGFTAPIAVWMFLPKSFSVGLVVAVLVILWFRLRRVGRLGLLKHGKVATVTNAEVLSSGTYYSGVTYQNMRVPQAHGWEVTRSFYSGPATTTKIDYNVDGATGSLKLRGLPYDQGVVLADPRKPDRAACVSAFAFSMEPGPDGQLVAHVSFWSWFGVICAVAMESSLVALTALVIAQTWFPTS